MTERPILFSGPMVRAILAGTKTQTRRVLKVEPPPGAERVIRPFHDERLHWAATDPHDMEQGQLVLGEAPRCPYGQPGDRLWVRETFQRFTDDGETLYKADPAGFEAMNELKRDECLEAFWRPSIHMPRWASRITLEVEAVRVERLRDISEADAQAEGVERDGSFYRGYAPGHYQLFPNARGSFASLWVLINGEGSWDLNPWVWVVAFRRLEVSNAST